MFFPSHIKLPRAINSQEHSGTYNFPVRISFAMDPLQEELDTISVIRRVHLDYEHLKESWWHRRVKIQF